MITRSLAMNDMIERSHNVIKAIIRAIEKRDGTSGGFKKYTTNQLPKQHPKRSSNDRDHIAEIERPGFLKHSEKSKSVSESRINLFHLLRASTLTFTTFLVI